jgi:hypothetical protein
MAKSKIPHVFKLFRPKEIDYSYQKNISFSQFQLYSQCPHKWYTQYVEKKIKTEPNINMVFGTAIHHIFQHYLSIAYKTSFAAADRENIIELFEKKLTEEYIDQYKKHGTHFSNPTELNEFYEDGVAILDWFKKKRRIYFSNKDTHLIGIEMLLQKEVSKNVIFKGYIDLVMYDSFNDTITIYDLKTSTKGWNAYAKKDETKISQILLYKQFFAELYDFPIDKINVEFLILKRKAEPNEYQEFPKRIQEFKPASGKIKIKASKEKLNSFIMSCFDEEGKYIIKEHPKNITKLCEYCKIHNTDLCKK